MCHAFREHHNGLAILGQMRLKNFLKRVFIIKSLHDTNLESFLCFVAYQQLLCQVGQFLWRLQEHPWKLGRFQHGQNWAKTQNHHESCRIFRLHSCQCLLIKFLSCHIQHPAMKTSPKDLRQLMDIFLCLFIVQHLDQGGQAIGTTSTTSAAQQVIRDRWLFFATKGTVALRKRSTNKHKTWEPTAST